MSGGRSTQKVIRIHVGHDMFAATCRMREQQTTQILTRWEQRVRSSQSKVFQNYKYLARWIHNIERSLNKSYNSSLNGLAPKCGVPVSSESFQNVGCVRPRPPLQVLLDDDALYNPALRSFHLSCLDEGMDARVRQRIAELRESGQMCGFAFTSDSSPPSAGRYAGLSFLITHIYILLFPDPSTWEDICYHSEWPFVREAHLCDMVHCPIKTGDEVIWLLDKQFQSKGLQRSEAVSGVGDGGGENEGAYRGIHAILENETPSYVRRRCMAHLSWRVADQAIAQICVEAKRPGLPLDLGLPNYGNS